MTVMPEFFDCASISFSDLPGFVVWVGNVASFRVIELLNCVYTAFDEEVSQYDVTKVETIADTYMVCYIVRWPLLFQDY